MIDLTWLVLRAASLVLTFQAAGVVLFVAAVAGELGDHQADIERFGRRAALASLALLAVQALFEPLHFAGDWLGLGVATLRVYAGSSAALALGVALIGMGCVALGLRRRGPAASGRPLALLGSLLTVASFLLTGHTVAHRERLLLAPLLFVHLAIVAFWFGSLRPLRRLALEAPPQAARVTAAFSATALWLVPLIGLSGIGIALLLLPDLAALRRPYGALLLGKLLLFGAVLGLAALNRQRLLPALERAEAGAAVRLARSIGIEFALLCVVFALTAVMSGALSPEDG